LEAGELEQTKLAAHITRELKARTRLPHEKPVIRDLTRNGEVVGSVSQDDKTVVVKLKASALTDNQKTRLSQFIDELLAAEV
jgi:hypothetical protein